ncbi:hypothetical protein MUK42_05559 [Musa troglodytarum]|uniref:Nitrate reductase n=1 Tax=Musa troglodytarum TaxID=320322 RepID=A0A9E7KN09_9LILI|nr:hypothetical protein MUK42_05559 [Musa troglodytarum]
MSEVHKHASSQSAWIVVHGLVYDCTAFVKDHPGGADSILINASCDCTEEFDAIHSDKAKALLDTYRIGELIPSGYVSDTSVHGGSELSHLATIREISRPPALVNPREKMQCKLVSKKNISHDVRLFKFALPSADQILGLPIGKHVFLCATIDGKLCMRAYTPTSSVDEVGHFELLIKSLTLGSTLDVKGPVGHIEYNGRGNFVVNGKPRFAKRLAMIAGGTGITPVYQVIQAVLRDPEDRTEMHLVYANRSEDDILLRDELDGWARITRSNLRCGQAGRWRYSTGYVTESILRDHIPMGDSDDTLALACGPPPMIQFAVVPNLEKMKYDTANSLLLF